MSHATGDADRWTNPARSRELPDLAAHLDSQENPE